MVGSFEGRQAPLCTALSTKWARIDKRFCHINRAGISPCASRYVCSTSRVRLDDELSFGHLWHIIIAVKYTFRHVGERPCSLQPRCETRMRTVSSFARREELVSASLVDNMTDMRIFDRERRMDDPFVFPGGYNDSWVDSCH